MRTSLRRSMVVAAATTGLVFGVTTPASAETAPDVIGLPGTEALALFEAAGFTNVKLSIRDSDNPVLSTSLKPGREAPADKLILLLLKYIPSWQVDDED